MTAVDSVNCDRERENDVEQSMAKTAVPQDPGSSVRTASVSVSLAEDRLRIE